MAEFARRCRLRGRLGATMALFAAAGLAASALAQPTPGPAIQEQQRAPDVRKSPASEPAPAPVATCSAVNGPPDLWTAKDYTALIGSLSGFLAFFVGIGAILSNIHSTRSNNNQKTNEAEIEAIEQKLDSFYGPYTQLSNTNKLVADELKSRHRGSEMRILLLMLAPGWRDGLSRGDGTLVDEIIDLGKKLLSLIQENSGMVDAAVQPYLYRAAAHFRMMTRAHEGKLDNEPTRYGAYVYPRQLDGVIHLEIERLRERMSLLRSQPMKQHPPLQPLSIPNTLALGKWPP